MADVRVAIVVEIDEEQYDAVVASILADDRVDSVVVGAATVGDAVDAAYKLVGELEVM